MNSLANHMQQFIFFGSRLLVASQLGCVASVVLMPESLHFLGQLFYINSRNFILFLANIEVLGMFSLIRPCKVHTYACDPRAGFTGFAMPSTELTWRQIVCILNETEIVGNLGYITTI